MAIRKLIGGIQLHPLVEEMITKGKELGLDLREISRRANVNYASITKWIEKGITPQRPSLNKIQRAIRRFDGFEEVQIQEVPDRQPPRHVIKKEWPEERKELYRLIYKIEGKASNGYQISGTSNTDPALYELHDHLGVEMSTENNDGSMKYCRIELDKLRKEHEISKKNMSKIVGKSPGWYESFMSGRDFKEDLAQVFANHFEVPIEELLNSRYRKEVVADAED